MRYVWLLAFLPEAACLFPSLDFTGGGDASIDASDAGTADAITDAPVESGPFCATAGAHFLCDDFDEPGFLSQWSKQYLDDGGSLTQDTDYVSPPSSLRCYLPAGTANGIGARVSTTLPASTTAVHMSFRIKLGSGHCDAGGSLDYYEIVKFGGDQDEGFGIQIDESGWQVHVDSQSDSPYLSPNPSTDTWHEVTIDVTYATQGAVHLVVDGTKKLDFTNIDTIAYQENTSIELGTYASGSCPANDVRYDDVTIDITP